jgi:hypothetical protein
VRESDLGRFNQSDIVREENYDLLPVVSWKEHRPFVVVGEPEDAIRGDGYIAASIRQVGLGERYNCEVVSTSYAVYVRTMIPISEGTELVIRKLDKPIKYPARLVEGIINKKRKVKK